jgi:hypothetical protein
VANWETETTNKRLLAPWTRIKKDVYPHAQCTTGHTMPFLPLLMHEAPPHTNLCSFVFLPISFFFSFFPYLSFFPPSLTYLRRLPLSLSRLRHVFLCAHTDDTPTTPPVTERYNSNPNNNAPS